MGCFKRFPGQGICGEQGGGPCNGYGVVRPAGDGVD